MQLTGGMNGDESLREREMGTQLNSMSMDPTLGAFFIASERSDRSRPVCLSFFYYVRAIHSAFFNIRRDHSDCSDFRRRF